MKKLIFAAALAAVSALAFLAEDLDASPRPQLITSASLIGGAEAVNIVLHDTDLTYMIPDGKVLLIDHLIWALESDSTHQRVSIKPPNDPAGVGDFQLIFSSTAPDYWTPTTPLRIVGGNGAEISIIKTGGADWRDVMIVGRLENA